MNWPPADGNSRVTITRHDPITGESVLFYEAFLAAGAGFSYEPWILYDTERYAWTFSRIIGPREAADRFDGDDLSRYPQAKGGSERLAITLSESERAEVTEQMIDAYRKEEGLT